MNIGERIREVREFIGLTLEELSEKIGISRQTLSRYETGAIKNIPISNIEALAKALNVPPAYLMGYENASEHEKITRTIVDAYLQFDPNKQDFLLRLVKGFSQGNGKSIPENELLTVFRKLNPYDQGKVLGLAMSLLQNPSEPPAIE